MSHQTGIKANAELINFFGKCRDGKIRTIKIVIENEALSLSKNLPVKGNWEDDFDKQVPGLIEEDQPCYVLYRLDSKNSLGYEWLFIFWSPDSAPVRQKMLYASTKATLKQEFGSAQLKDELHGTAQGDITLKGFKKHLRIVSEPAPLTDREEALQALRIQEHQPDFSMETRHQTIGGVSFPVTDEAKQSLTELKNGTHNYLQFKIDIGEEKIHLAKSSTINVGSLSSETPANEARYHLFIFKHNHESDHFESVVFIYTMPGYNCSIKERMLYSSCKGPFLDLIAQNGIEVVKKIEVDDGSELTEEFLHEEIHPKRNLHRPAFAKPKGPPNRGAKRITKPQSAQS